MGATSEGTQIEIEPADLAAWLEREQRPQVIDVREPYERQAGHIADTRHVPLVELSGAAASVEKDRPVVFYCRVGSRSQMAAQAFRTAGFDAYTLTGGLVRWVAEGRPLVPEGGRVADH